MNIRRQFNRLAAGLVLGMAVGCTAPAGLQADQSSTNSKLVPAGQNPSFIQDFYKKIGGVRKPPKTTKRDETAAKGSPPDFSTFSIRTSVTSFSTIPDNKWLRELKALPPAEAEQTVRPCLETLCTEKFANLNPAQKTIGHLMVLEAMFHNGLDEQEHETYAEYLKKFQPDDRLKATDDRVIGETVKTILESDEYRSISRHLIPVAQITPDKVREQFYLRLDFMKFVADTLRKNYGYEPLPIYLDVFPQNISNTLAFHVPPSFVKGGPRKSFILVNYNAAAVDNVDGIILRLTHEVRHSIDENIGTDLKQRLFTSEDQRFTHAAVLALNNNAYINACAAITPPPSNCAQQFDWYRNQYMERSAYDFAEKFLKMLKEGGGSEVKATPPQTSYRFEPQKLQLPT